MNSTPASTAAHMMTGATLGGGALEWLTVNSSAVTAIAVMLSAIASIALGLINSQTARKRLRVNRRDITQTIIHDLKTAGKSQEYITDFINHVRY
jgi:hypothetical protein